MRKEIILITCCAVALIFLQACSKSSDDNNPWPSPSKLHDADHISLSKASSNANGDVILVWEELEQQVRVNQVLTDAHNPLIPYTTDAAISADRDMNPDPEIFEAYDSANDTHRTDAKVADYNEHGDHIHVDIYNRLSIKTRVFSASRGSWLNAETLQTGFWQKTQSGNRPLDDANNEQLVITDNLSSYPTSHVAIATNSAGSGVVAWLQLQEDSDVAGDAADGYNLYAAHYSTSSGSWSTVEQLTLPDNEMPTLNDLAVSLNADGDAQLLWLARDNSSESVSQTHVYQAAYDSGAGTWSGSVVLSDPTTSAEAVKVVMFNSTSGIALWTRLNSLAKSTYLEQDGEGNLCDTTASICDATQINLYAHRFDDAGWQGTPLLISDGLGDVGSFDVAAKSASLWTTWEQNDAFVQRMFIDGIESYINSTAANGKIVVSQFDTEAFTWSAPAAINKIADDGSYEHSKQPTIAIDESGTAMVSWSQETPIGFGDVNSSKWNNNQREAIWINIFESSWGEAQQIALDDQFSYLQPKAVSPNDNKFTIAWRGWSTSHAQSGHQLFSADYNSATDTVSQIFAVNRTASLINSFDFIPVSNRVRLIWSGNNNKINTVSK